MDAANEGDESFLKFMLVNQSAISFSKWSTVDSRRRVLL
jgi:hypothetical protein